MVYINTTGKHNEVWLDKPYATITVECPDCPSTEDAYNSGWTDGSEDGYHKGYQSGRTDGYDDGWGPGYESGFTDGLEACSGETIHNQTKSFNILDTGGDLKVKYEYGAYQFENITEDIRPNSGYTGLERVGLYMYIYPGEALQDGFNSGYTSGYTDGLNACSGGSCEGVWEDGYDSGYTDGQESVDCTEFYNSGVTDGYGSGYTSGYTDGLNACSGGNEDLIGNLEGDYFIIPEGTTHLRDYAFYYTCFSSITIPYSVTAIGAYSFYGNGCLETITIPDSVISIGVNAFFRCTNLTAATLGSGCTSLPNSMFGYAESLTGITIPETITNIGPSVFRDCSALTHITFNSLIPPRLGAISGTTASLGSTAYTFPIYVPCQSLDAYKTAFGEYYAPRIMCNSGYTPATSITLNVDSAITGTGQATVTVNPSDAGTDITYTSSDPSKATIDEDGVITVVGDGDVTFCAIDQITELQDCKTVSVSLPIPANTSILDFIYETSAANQTIRLFTGTAPESDYFYAFYSAITRMDIDGVPVEKSENNIYKTYPRSGDWYFYTFPTAGRHNVKYYVQTNFHPSGLIFPGLILSNLIFSQSDGYDGSHPEYPDAMPPCPLVEAHVGEGYTVVSQGTFQSVTTLTAVTLSESLQALGTYAFEESGIISITIPDACTSLYDITSQPSFFNGEVFVKAPNLSSVTIGSGITSIPSNTFYGCSALTTVVMRNPVPPTVIRTQTYVVPGTRLDYVELFETCPLEHIYVPASAVEDYKAATNWSNYASIISAIQ